MFLFFLLLFILLPFLEILFLFYISDLWGWGTSVLLILISGVLGLFLVRREGMQTLARLQQAVVAGRSPATEMLEALSLFLGGILLIVPGFLTDVLGFILVMPYSRRLFSVLVQRKWKKTQTVWVGSMRVGGFQSHGYRSPDRPSTLDEDIIEVEAIEVSEINSGAKDSGVGTPKN